MIRAMPLMAAMLLAGDARSQDAVSFERDVAPILQARCQGCHQPAKASGGVLLVTHRQLLGDDSSSVVAGQPDDSMLLDVVTSTNGDAPSMPPEGAPLSDAELATIRRWIEEGASDDTAARSLGLRNAKGEPLYRKPPVVTSLAYSPDGTQFAVAGRGEALLHLADGAGVPIARLVGLSERIESIAFSPDGARLAVAGGTPARRGELQIWDVASRTLEVSRTFTYDTLRGVSWSSDGTRIAVGCTDHSVRVLEASGGDEVLFQGAHSDWVLGTAFSKDDSHLVTVSRDRSMKLIKVESQQFIDNITSITPGALRGGLMAVARRPELDQLLVGGADGAPKLYKMYREKKRVIGDDFNLLRAFTRLPGRVFSVGWRADGKRFVAGASLRGEGTVAVYDADADAPTWSREVPSGVYAVAFRPGGTEVAAAGYDGVVRILAGADGALLREVVPVPLQSGSWKLLEAAAR